ncbi:nucleoporin [Gloeophyllum trabeum ATCC 11539]|uniref:Nucleoporin n=1 Tax=Gloeophyllum trabeum (strain ATCC 11539 / FP-39264 / Madison 617) TaxID=670483 RepID=S7QM04_GLOTA|nr:nucleoporin [Gloeophyllum trabeum ATCC 11539]EPQ60591.1 nucleoporin [Gloeophyllum trabeum ATCC 11539]
MFKTAGPSSVVSRNAIPGSKSPAAPDLPALQSASRVLQDQISKDAQLVPDVGDLLTNPQMPFSSSYSVFNDNQHVPFAKRRIAHIPDAVFYHYDSANVTSHMGLMPEIDRVWITIDHKLFLWDYVEGQELHSFVDQPDVISHVALVKPKPNIFIDEIVYLLVICTPVSVLLLGLSVSTPPPGSRSLKDIKLYATDMSITTEVEMTSVIGTKNGRIFMCGAHDGNLYELHYQEKEGWFGKKVQLVNHSVSGMQSLFPMLATPRSEDNFKLLVSDPSRDCFYALSSRNTISIYRPNGEKSVQQLQTLSSLYNIAQQKVPGHPAITPSSFQIVSLHVIEKNEAPRSGVQLMATTVNGVRLYFGPSSAGYGYSFNVMNSSSSIPGHRPLQLVHVRLPPVNLLHPDDGLFTASALASGQPPPQPAYPPYVVSRIENVCYTSGLTIAAEPGDGMDGNDFILCMAPDLTKIGELGQVKEIQPQQPPRPPMQSYYPVTTPGPSRPPLTEYATMIEISGRTWAIAPIPRTPYHSSTPSESPVPVAANELAVQFCEPPTQFMILTNAGLVYLWKRRALDYLRAVIEDFHADGNPQPILDFRDSFGRDQTCAMLLALASGNTFLDIDNFASPTLSTGKIANVSSEIAAVAKQAFYDFGERPMWAERATLGTSENAGSAIFSGRREGFAFYFARLVRPLWKVKLVQTGALGLAECGIPEETLVTTQKNLHALKEFLDKNPHLFHSAPGDKAGARGAAASEQEAWKAEQSSVSQLQALLARTIEAISFLLLLVDYKLADLIAQCDPETQKMITSLTFEGLVVTSEGITAARALVNVVIDQQIGQQISVDTISEVLQERCGSFCSTDDVLFYKAKENVRKAAETVNLAEKQNWLNESLRLFIKAGAILTLEKLREICGEYQQLRYPKGAVELPLHYAQVVDAERLGQEYWYAGCPASDRRSEFWERRKQCYDLVLDSLTVFEERAGAAPEQGDGPEDPETIRSHAFALAFASNDEMFHSTMYEWLLGKGVADELLEMRPPYLEAHLRREPITVQKYQLLWQFYVKNGQPLRAAEVLAALADSLQLGLTLEERLEYLTLAVGNAKSHPISAEGRHETAIAFLAELEDKLEVAQVQLEMYHTLVPHIKDAEEVRERIQLLGRRLFTMTELFELYAAPFDLREMQLLILHVSDHRDEHLVRPIWNRIFADTTAGVDPKEGADQLISKVVSLGHRFYPSESAFPLQYIASLLVRFELANKGVIPYGWAPRVLVQCGVPYGEIWDIFNEMYESQVPPFNDQSNVQAISSDIAVLLTDWMQEAQRPLSSAAREFPVDRIDGAVGLYLSELDPNRTETKAAYEALRRYVRTGGKVW